MVAPVDVSNVANGFSSFFSSASHFGDGSWLSVIKYIVAGVLTLGAPFLNQEATELIIAAFKVPFFVKPFVSHVLASAVGGIMLWSGADPATAAVSAGYLMAGTKFANQTPWALELEKQFDAWRAAKLSGATPAAAKSIADVAGKLPMILFLLGAMALAGVAKAADTVATTVAPMIVAPVTATGWIGTPSTFVTGPLMSVQNDGEFIATSESGIGVQYNVSLGDFSENTSGGVQYESLLYISLGLGTSAGTGNPRAIVTGSVGYKDVGLVCVWNAGSGMPPMVGVQGQIPIMSLVHGLVWDISGTVSKKFAGANW